MTDSSCIASSTPSSSNKQLNVLVVNYIERDREYMRTAFMSMGCNVIVAENGKEALNFLGLGCEQCNESNNSQSSNVNLIVADYCMPEVSGFKLLKKVKESSSTREIPVVLLSDYNFSFLIEWCKNAGALKFLQKPVKQEDIEMLISSVTLGIMATMLIETERVQWECVKKSRFT